MSKRKKFNLKKFEGALPYVAVGVLTLGVVALGSLDKQNADVNLSLATFAANDYDVSVDQMSELYVVADLSDALGLASASDVASNYVVTTTMYDSGQTAVGKLEKPALTDVGASRGVIEYTVGEGETLDSLAAKYGVSVDQIRWSNGLKSAEVGPGTVLYIPSAPGIVYMVKAGDTIESIAGRYGSSTAEIIAMNDLEVSGLVEGMRIVIRDGSLPETERPEYVAPTRTYTATTYAYTYLGNTSERQNIQVVGYYSIGGGQCVDWALYMRPDLQPYAMTLGNANNWARGAASIGRVVNRTPAPGAIFQTSSGWYGHVGYVESVNGDGSIVVTEMNYGIPYRVIRATIPASAVGNFNYIH
ncbi:LysM peptidoglycan-binding domain-containing protein [Candidatus Saccharibacteria bacterium]|nr:LysM peptidoglycan-binding domain-containing protein [Candidatus Saccharibacteria bacterium]